MTSRNRRAGDLRQVTGRANNRVFAGLLLAVTLLGVTTAAAADKIRVGKSVVQPFAFAPLEIGTAEGIWAKYGLETEVIIFNGDAKLQQGLVANAVDFGLGSGPAMGFLAKGVPAKAVAAIANEPLSMGLVMGPASNIRDAAGAQGRQDRRHHQRLVELLVDARTVAADGLGFEGIETVALGAIGPQFAALKVGQVDGLIVSSSQGYGLEAKNEGRLLLKFGSYIKDFHTHVIFATDDMIDTSPTRSAVFSPAGRT